MNHPTPTRLTVILLCAGLGLAGSAACSKTSVTSTESTTETPPAAPSFDGWTIKTDTVVQRDKIGEVEYRLEGKIKALRNTVYEVHGKKVQLNVIVPQDAQEADKLFRILANKKPAWAYVRKGGLIYEFVGQNESMEDIQAAQGKLSAP